MQILKFEQLDSTNNYAKALIKEGKAKNWQVIVAGTQNSGRGQANNIWESEPKKNLTFSLIFKPEQMEAKNQFLISQAVSVGVVNYLIETVLKARHFVLDTKSPKNKEIGFAELRFAPVAGQARNDDQILSIHIKWPNDIYVGMKKIAGILIEHTIQGNQILFSVIGIGLNVNQTEFSKNAGHPTSLQLLNKVQYDLDTELDELTAAIADSLDFLRFDNGEECKKLYLRHLLFLNEEREYCIRGEKITGKIIGTNVFGFLQIQAKNGTLFECDLKEVVYLGKKTC